MKARVWFCAEMSVDFKQRPQRKQNSSLNAASLHHRDPVSDITKPPNETVFKHEHLGNRAESGTLPEMSQICFLFTS